MNIQVHHLQEIEWTPEVIEILRSFSEVEITDEGDASLVIDLEYGCVYDFIYQCQRCGTYSLSDYGFDYNIELGGDDSCTVTLPEVVYEAQVYVLLPWIHHVGDYPRQRCYYGQDKAVNHSCLRWIPELAVPEHVRNELARIESMKGK